MAAGGPVLAHRHARGGVHAARDARRARPADGGSHDLDRARGGAPQLRRLRDPDRRPRRPARGRELPLVPARRAGHAGVVRRSSGSALRGCASGGSSWTARASSPATTAWTAPGVDRALVFSERTAWARNAAAPVRDFLNTESGSAVVLLAATVAALLWANSPWSSSYESVWTTKLSIQLGGDGISLELREWINQGLMTLFFLVVGLRPSGSSTWRASRAPAAGAAGAGRPGWHGGRRADLPRLQRRRPGGAGLGCRDVDRHGVRARASWRSCRVGPSGCACACSRCW